jgi:hypothetical protein
MGIDAPPRRCSGTDAAHAVRCTNQVQPDAVYVAERCAAARDNPLAACLLFDKGAWFSIPLMESTAIALQRHALLFMREAARGMTATLRR